MGGRTRRHAPPRALGATVHEEHLGGEHLSECMSDILACVECCCAIALHLGGE